MRHLGRFQLGDRLPVVVRTLVAGVPAWPAAPPLAVIYPLGGDLLDERQPAATLFLGAADPSAITGLYRRAVFLGPTFANWEGRYVLTVRWADADGAAHTRAWTFDVVPGGSSAGDITGMARVIRPGQDLLLVQRYDESLATALNPR